jgi:arginine utilization regulatory protein
MSLVKQIEEKERLLALERENRLFKAVLDSVHEGVQISDERSIMIYYNSAAEKYEMLSREKVLGKKVTEVYDVTEETSTHVQVLRTARPVIEQRHQYYANGKRVDVIASTYPYIENGKVMAVFSVNRDVTKMTEFMARTVELQKQLASGRKSGNGRASEGGATNINGTKFTLEDIVGTGPGVGKVVDLARKCASHGSSVMIYGETGTGKELFAQGIHNASEYAAGPFIAINCAAIPETLLESLMFGTVKGAFTGAVDAAGLFEQAENGSLYLDEINSMGLNLQAKLLRVIQDKVVRRVGDHRNRAINCRILCSTNRDPFDAVKDREIREDLYYRLAATILFIPPLRDRQDDLAALCQFFISKYNQQFGTAITEVSPELYAILHHHSWPGNVRELEHLIESSMTLVNPEDDLLTPEHLPLFLQGKFLHQLQDHCETGSSCKLLQMLEEYEKRILKETLKKNRWNVTQTSKDLGIFRQALQYRIKRYNLAPGDE